jgi:hypothetical protein
VCHAADRDFFHDTGSAGERPCATNWHNPVRGFCRNGRRGGGDRVCCCAAWSWRGAGPMGSGSGGAARDRAALSGRSWSSQAADTHAAFPARRCPDRSRGGVALQGAGCGGRRNPGQSASAELHCDETAGDAGRGDGFILLADPAGGDCRSERCARPLADRLAALGGQSGRSARTGRSALAGRAVPVARPQAGHMGGAA